MFMKKKYIVFTLVVLLGTMLHANAQCPSYESAYPPPFPESWPCMVTFMADNPNCCSGEFDQACMDALKAQCGDASNCSVDSCLPDGCSNLTYPQCNSGEPCESYNSANPPPGIFAPFDDDVPLNAILVELFCLDGLCCQFEMDNWCWSELDTLISTFVDQDFGCFGDNGSAGCDDLDPATINGVSSQLGCTFTPVPATSNPLIAKLKVILEGAFDTDTKLMSNALKTGGLIPLAQPFNQAPWNYAGPENAILQSNIPANAVDWVLVELRQNDDRTNVLATRAGLLLDDGSIVDADGVTNGLAFPASLGLTLNTNYYVSVRPRGHVAVISSMPIWLPNRLVYDFSTNGGQVLGTNTVVPFDSPSGSFPIMSTNQMKLMTIEFLTGLDYQEYWACLAGDINGDGVITVTDFNDYQMQLEAGSVNVYEQSDINKDKSITVADFNLYQANTGHIGHEAIRY